MIGLTEHGGEYERRGYTGEGMARGYRTFRRRGMPFATLPRPHVHGTWPMCRAVVAARLTEPGREWSVFRALQVAQFTTTLDLETAEGIAAALERVPGIDVERLLEAAAAPETEAAFAADRAEARTAEGSPTEFQGKAATTPDGRRPLHGAEPRLHGRRRPPARGGRLPVHRGLRRDRRQPRSDAAPPRSRGGRRRGARRLPGRRHDRRGRRRDGAGQHRPGPRRRRGRADRAGRVGRCAAGGGGATTRCGRRRSGGRPALLRCGASRRSASPASRPPRGR